MGGIGLGKLQEGDKYDKNIVGKIKVREGIIVFQPLLKMYQYVKF